MQEGFEKNIENKLGGFKLQPSPMIWKEVDAALHPSKKRRVLVWWWLPLLMVFFATGGYLFFGGNEGKNPGLPNAPVIAKQTNKTIKETTETDDEIKKIDKAKNQLITEAELQETKVSTSDKAAKEMKQSVLVRKVAKGNRIADSKIFISRATEAVKVIAVGNTAEETIVYKNSDNAKTVKVEGIKSIENILPAVEKNDSLVAMMSISEQANDSLNKTKLTAAAKLDSVTVKKLITKINKPVKHQWLVMIGGGKMTINESAITNSNKDLAAFNNTNVASGGLMPGTTSAKLAVPTGGFHVEAGLHYRYTLAKRLQLTTGINYRYIQNKQSYQNDSVGTSRVVYTGNNGKNVTNYAHWLQVPLSASYSLNPASKNRFSIIGGASLAWAFSSHWLVTDIASKQYYYDPSLANKLLVNVHAGLSFNQNDNFQIALIAEQSLTGIHNNVKDVFYYTQYTLQVTKPVNLQKLFNKKRSR